jgi:hypothetical protein
MLIIASRQDAIVDPTWELLNDDHGAMSEPCMWSDIAPL